MMPTFGIRTVATAVENITQRGSLKETLALSTPMEKTMQENWWLPLGFARSRPLLLYQRGRSQACLGTVPVHAVDNHTQRTLLPYIKCYGRWFVV